MSTWLILFLVPVFFPASFAVAWPCDRALREATERLLKQHWTKNPDWKAVSYRQFPIGNEGLTQIMQLVVANLGQAETLRPHYFLVTATCKPSTSEIYTDEIDDPADAVILKHITQDRR